MTTKGRLYTKACVVLGITYPIVQAGMAGRELSSAELVAAVSNSGALGVLGCLGRSAEEAVADIRRVRSLTNRPFGVNFVVEYLDADTFSACLAERVPVFSFFRGRPADAIKHARATGAMTIHQTTTIAEAVEAGEAGVDVLIAQGHEAGGHCGPVPLSSLLPDVIAVANERPVLAAGGIVDGRGIAAAMCMGAAGVQMGTRFLATSEAAVSAPYKQAILNAQSANDTVASTFFDTVSGGSPWPGVQVRALRNKLTERWLGREHELPAHLAEAVTKQQQAHLDSDPEEMIMLAGSGVGRIRELKSASQVVHDAVTEAVDRLSELGAL